MRETQEFQIVMNAMFISARRFVMVYMYLTFVIVK